MFDYAGCLHFHSAYSYDAGQPLERIIEAAHRAKLDFALLTDHFNLDAKRDGWERYHDAGGRRLLLLVGEEISPRYNHYLACDISEPIVLSKMEAHSQDMIDEVNRRGGFGFIAHPDHGAAPLIGARGYPWVDWNVRGYAGMSIWDLMGDLSSTLTSPWRVARAFFCPMQVIGGPKRQTLERWDALCQSGHVAAIGEIDNHGSRKSFLGFSKSVLPFDLAFRTIRTHVLLSKALSGDAEQDKPVIYQALRSGQSYIAFDYWHDATGFKFEVVDAAQRVSMGGEIVRKGAALVEAKLPAPGRVRLIRNGRVIREEYPRSYMERDADLPGVYRLEADRKVRGRWRPWIYSNPIWVR